MNIKLLQIVYVPKKISIVLHNGSSYNYQFIIKELAEKFGEQFTCLGESTFFFCKGSTEQYTTLLLSIEKEVAKVDESGKDHTKTMLYRLKFIDSTRSMESSLSNLVNNLAERIHKIKCKYRHYDKKCENCGIKYKDCDCFLKYTTFRDHLIEYECLFCNKNYERKFDEILKKIFFIHTNFPTMIPTSLFYCCEMMFTLMNIWMIRRNSMKFHCLKKKIFTVT